MERIILLCSKPAVDLFEVTLPNGSKGYDVVTHADGTGDNAFACLRFHMADKKAAETLLALLDAACLGIED